MTEQKNVDTRPELYLPGPAIGEAATIVLYHLRGAMDAGGAGELAVSQLLSTLPSRRVATFNSDLLIDYRSHRPIISLSDWIINGVEMPEIALDRLIDDDGTPILLLHGPEPDMRWGQFVESIADLLRQSGVRSAVGLSGMPAAVPHTRPVVVNVHSTNPELLPEQPGQMGEISLSASLQIFLEAFLGEQGLNAVGLVAAVPYYMAENEYPPASAAMLGYLANHTGLALPVGDLEAAAAKLRPQLAEHLGESPDVARIVDVLEQQFDAGRDAGAFPHQPEDPRLPSGDEIGKRLEQFLFQESQREQIEDMGMGPFLDGPGPIQEDWPAREDNKPAPEVERATPSTPKRPSRRSRRSRGRHLADVPADNANASGDPDSPSGVTEPER